jgi:hypothetical protein
MTMKRGSIFATKSRVAMTTGMKEAQRLIEENHAGDGDDADSFARGVMLGAYVRILMTWGIERAYLQAILMEDGLTARTRIGRRARPKNSE